jgi:hypothetical protein
MAQLLQQNADMMQGDTGIALVLSITANGTAYDLTGATVNLQWKNSSGVIVSKQMSITNATGGVCSYTFSASDTFAGNMTFQAVITTASGGQLTTLQFISLAIGSPL